MSARDMTADIDPNMNLGLARILYDGFNDGFENDIKIKYGNKLLLEDSAGNDVEIHVEGTTLTLPATSATTTVDSVSWSFGSGSDVTFTFDGTKFVVLCPVADDTEIEWGDGTESFDQEFFFAAAGNTVYFNASDNTVTFNGVDLYLFDDDTLEFGNSKDVVMQWAVGGGFNITCAADNSVITWGATGNSFDMIWNLSTSASLITISAAGDTMTLNGVDLHLLDDDNLSFGNSQDVVMQWAAGGGLNVTAAADNSVWTWGATGNSFDMIWNCETSAKLITISAAGNTLTLDDVDLYLGDNDSIEFGDSQDFVLAYTTKLTLTALADDTVFEIGNGTNSIDVIWFGETAANNVTFDADSDIVIFEAVNLILMDDDFLAFGDVSDVVITWAAGGGLNVTCAADNTVWTWGATGTSFDMIWYGVSSAKFIKIDTSEDTIQFDDFDIYMGDNDSIEFGDSQDVVVAYTTKMTILAAADDETLEIGNGTESFNVTIFGDSAADAIKFVPATNTVTFNGIDLYMDDADELCFGDDQDVTISFEPGGNLVFDAGTDDLVIEIGNSNATQKSFDVIIYGDAASGVDYFKFDAGASSLSWAGAASLSLSTYTCTKIVAKTGDYTVTAADTGTIFTTVGSSADVEFTLPTLAAGLVYEFYAAVEFEMKITSAAGNDIIGYNNATASSLVFTTATEQIGAWIRVVCDGTFWLCTYSGGGTGTEYTMAFA